MNKLDKLNTGISDLHMWSIEYIKPSVSPNVWAGIAAGFTKIKNAISSEAPPDVDNFNDLANKEIDEILDEIEIK